jgi:hypothetical protein
MELVVYSCIVAEGTCVVACSEPMHDAVCVIFMGTFGERINVGFHVLVANSTDFSFVIVHLI